MFAAIEAIEVVGHITTALSNVETVLIAGLTIVGTFYGFRLIKKALANAK